MNDTIIQINGLIHAAARDIAAVTAGNAGGDLYQRDASNNLALAQAMALASIAESLERIAAVLEENNTENGFLVDTPDGATKRSIEVWRGADN